VRVRDEDGNKIELKSDDDDDFRDNIRDRTMYRSDDSEIIAEGYSIEDVEFDEAEDLESDFEEDEDDEAADEGSFDDDLYELVDDEEETL
jgi:hypothetical protein